MESAVTGILAGVNALRRCRGNAPLRMDPNTMMGALLAFITDPTQTDFQPVNANFGILPPLEMPVKDKKKRYEAYATRSGQKMMEFLSQAGLPDTEA